MCLLAMYMWYLYHIYCIGKHHCPRPRVKGTFSTSYADHYKNIKIAQNNGPRP